MRAVYALFGFGLSENSTTEPALSDKGTASDILLSRIFVGLEAGYRGRGGQRPRTAAAAAAADRRC
jgi:hypothetical protein